MRKRDADVLERAWRLRLADADTSMLLEEIGRRSGGMVCAYHAPDEGVTRVYLEGIAPVLIGLSIIATQAVEERTGTGTTD